MIDILREFIAALIMEDAQTIADDDELLLSGVLDSMDIAQLVVFIAEEFSIDVPPEDLRIENFQTLESIAGYLEKSDRCTADVN